MRFSLASVFLCVALVNAVALPEPAPKMGDVNKSIPKSKSSTLSGTKAGGKGGKITPKKAPATQDSQKLQKRIVPLVILLGAPVLASSIGIITKIAIELGQQTLANLQEWNKVREAFTQKTTEEMWARNPDYKKFPAVACYNKGYRLQNAGGVDGKLSVKVELGLLNTNYDCMFVTAPNQFYTDAAGGYINLSYTYDPTRCTFDGSTGDLSCK